MQHEAQKKKKKPESRWIYCYNYIYNHVLQYAQLHWIIRAYHDASKHVLKGVSKTSVHFSGGNQEKQHLAISA